MSVHLAALAIGFSLFMVGVGYVIYAVMKMANDEEPGCINPGNHK